MKTDAQLKKAIMRRVYVVFWARRLMAPKVRLAAFALIIAAIASTVSLPHIIQNALRSSDLVGFSVAAVSHTTLFVQLGVLLAGVIIIASLVEAVRPRALQFN
jgi:hypothetical protein